MIIVFNSDWWISVNVTSVRQSRSVIFLRVADRMCIGSCSFFPGQPFKLMPGRRYITADTRAGHTTQFVQVDL